MNLLKHLLYIFLPFHNQYKQFRQAKLQTKYIDFLKFKIGLQKRYFPADKNCLLSNYNKIYLGINCLIGRSGNYLQGAGNLYIGNYVQFAPNVGVLTSNHDLYDQRISVKKEVIIGDYCWVGMNSVILPGVTLGTRTIVAAGSVVTKSFPNGFCVIGGSPAKIIKELDANQFVPWKDKFEFYGFIPKHKFEKTEKYKKLKSKINSI